MTTTTDLIFKPEEISLQETFLGKLLKQWQDKIPVFNKFRVLAHITPRVHLIILVWVTTNHVIH